MFFNQNMKLKQKVLGITSDIEEQKWGIPPLIAEKVIPKYKKMS